MNLEEVLQQYPSKRIKPEDGMAVTEQVWEEAHDYHRETQNLHTLLAHGSGIIAGLEVIASDPPNTSVFILPGVAVDTVGQTVLLPQPVSYDIGTEMMGRLYLLLSYGESKPRAINGHKKETDDPLYIYAEFSISAQTALPASPYVELARMNRSDRQSVFVNAQNPALPGPNEIDLRFRREVGAPQEVRIAVTYLGQVANQKHGQGAGYLAQSLNHRGRYHVSVENNVPLGPGIVPNTLVYLVGQGEFELEQAEVNGLSNYVNRGKGTLLIESVDAAAEASFQKFLQAAGLQTESLPSGHRLLAWPNLFSAPPSGFETQSNPQVQAGEGVIFTTYNYGLLWQGERRGRLASREEIRTALEWGDNIVTYAVERRRLSGHHR